MIPMMLRGPGPGYHAVNGRMEPEDLQALRHLKGEDGFVSGCSKREQVRFKKIELLRCNSRFRDTIRVVPDKF